MLRKEREANAHESRLRARAFAWQYFLLRIHKERSHSFATQIHVAGQYIYCVNILHGLVMVSTGIMQLEKRVARDALNSKIKIKR